MELLKEAKNVVDFASYYPLLNKATTDNDTPTPGYVYEEIIKMSHNSSGHRQLLIDFLLARLHSSSWPGKQKVIRIFQHLCTRGHRGVRVSLRGQDGELRKAAAAGGPPDPLLANTPQLFLSSAIQELLAQLFDSKTMKEDEQWLAGRDKSEENSSSSLSVAAQGYGSHGVKGKYEGFGSSPNVPSDSLVTQVRGMVERVMSTSGDTNSLDLLKGDKGDYQPLSLPSLGSVPPSQPVPQIQMQLLSASQKSKYKAHRKGRAGGGWESDEDIPEVPVSPLTSEMDLSPGPASSHSSSDAHSSGAAEEQLLNTLTDAKMRWPLDHDMLVGMSQDCATLNLPLLLGKISHKCSLLAAPTTSDPQAGETSCSSTDYPFLVGCDSKNVVPPLASPDTDTRTTRLLALLLLVEFGMHYDVLPPALVHSHLGQTLIAVKENKNLESTVQLKARKLSLIVSNFV